MTSIVQNAKKIKDLEKLINQSIKGLKEVLKSRGLDIEIEVDIKENRIILKSELDLIFPK